MKLKLNTVTETQQNQAYKQLTLPIKLGGSGLTVMSEIMHSAYVSSVAHSHEFAAKTPTELYSIANINQPLSSQFISHVDNCITETKKVIPNSVAQELLPTSASNFRQFGLFK